MEQKYKFPITGVGDMNLASYLMYCGFELVDIIFPQEQKNERFKNKFGFIFRSSEFIKSKMQEYFEEKTMVDAKRLFNCRKLIKQKITEKKEELNK